MENNNGKGIFLGVVSVATLVVAIIGATFAYFSASVTGGEGNITGNTLDVSGTALSLSVSTKKNVGGTLNGEKGEKLVPAAIDETDTGYATAVSRHCEDLTNGYTECGPWGDSDSLSAYATFDGYVLVGDGDGDYCDVCTDGLFRCIESSGGEG